MKQILTLLILNYVVRLKSKAGTGTEVMVDPLTVFHQALENSKPIMGTIGVRRGGKLYQVSTMLCKVLRHNDYPVFYFKGPLPTPL